jgi:hypothetical protein
MRQNARADVETPVCGGEGERSESIPPTLKKDYRKGGEGCCKSPTDLACNVCRLMEAFYGMELW